MVNLAVSINSLPLESVPKETPDTSGEEISEGMDPTPFSIAALAFAVLPSAFDIFLIYCSDAGASFDIAPLIDDPEDEQKTIYKIVDAFIRDTKTQKAYA